MASWDGANEQGKVQVADSGYPWHVASWKGDWPYFWGVGVSMEFRHAELAEAHKETTGPRKKGFPRVKTRLTQPSDFFGFRNDRYSQYLTLVRRALYDGVAIDFSSLHRSWTIAAIGALAMSSKRGSAQVYTLNYDDAVERYLSYHGYICRPIFEERDASMAADVHVFHPHGFIPSPGSQYTSLSKKIILDRRSYSRALGDIEDWWGRQNVKLRWSRISACSWACQGKINDSTPC